MLKLLFMTRVGQFLLLALAFVALYAFWFERMWALNLFNKFAEPWLLNLGVGLGLVALWLLVFIIIWHYRKVLIFRQWRLVFGSIGLTTGAIGILAYFDGTLPLIGMANLGGEYGLRIQGENELASYVRVGAVLAISFWVIGPLRFGKSGNLVSFLFMRIAYVLGFGVRMILLFIRALIWVSTFRFLGSVTAKFAKSGTLKRESELTDALGEFLGNSDINLRDRPGDGVPSRNSMVPPASISRNPKMIEKTKPRPSSNPIVRQKSIWRLPSLDLLNPGSISSEISNEHSATARLIEESLAQHGVEVQVAEVRPGPTVTMFGLVPGWSKSGKAMAKNVEPSQNRGNDADEEKPFRNRVKVDSILAREKDLALSLAAPSLRIQAPVPGESVVGVEVPNRVPTIVTIRAVMDSDAYRHLLEKDGLPIALGQASAGESVAVDLLNMPHLLIAGATGSGKSVCINSVIASLIVHQDPSKVRLLLIDPKRVELTPYNGIPHLIAPVLVEPSQVVRLLKGAIQEMLRRYKLLEDAAVRNIQSYNRSPKASEPLPYIVVCIDELADLMMTSAFEVEQSICRLAQLGRATGIHLIVATQRPSVDVVTGLIKANFPSRISFAVASQVDSRTILDSAGAERLMGRGDMLFLSPTDAKPRRVQGVYVSEDEVQSATEHWRHGRDGFVPEINLELLAYQAEATAVEQDFAVNGANGKDSLFDRAMQLAVANRQLSTSLLQRRLRIGYPRAARLMDELEDMGVVAPSGEPGKPREVLRYNIEG